MNVNIDFLNGYLYSIGNFCYGTNFVPDYGASEFAKTDNSFEKSLANHSAGRFKYSDLKKSENSPKKEIFKLLHSWVETKLFDQQNLAFNSEVRSAIRLHQCYLDEFIEEIAGENCQLYTFKIDGEDFGYQTEALAFFGEMINVYIYFGWMD